MLLSRNITACNELINLHPVSGSVEDGFELCYLPSSVTAISGNLVQYFLILKKKSSSYIILVIHDIEAHKMLHRATYVCKYVLIVRAGASTPSRTTGPRCLYIYICIYVCIYPVRVPDTVNF